MSLLHKVSRIPELDAKSIDVTIPSHRLDLPHASIHHRCLWCIYCTNTYYLHTTPTYLRVVCRDHRLIPNTNINPTRSISHPAIPLSVPRDAIGSELLHLIHLRTICSRFSARVTARPQRCTIHTYAEAPSRDPSFSQCNEGPAP